VGEQAPVEGVQQGLDDKIGWAYSLAGTVELRE